MQQTSPFPTKARGILVAWIASLAIGAASPSTSLRLVRSIALPHVKGGFDLMAVDVAGARLFVAAENNGTIEVLDVKAGRPRRSIAGFDEPKWVVYRPESHRLYVSNGGDGSVRVLDADSFEPGARFAFREKANNLRFDPATQELFVGVGRTFGAIGIVDTIRGAVAGEIALAAAPKQFELDGERIYVNVPEANHVAVVDRKSRAVIHTWPVAAARNNVPMGLDREHHRLFVGCEPGRLVVFDTETGGPVADLAIDPDSDGISYDGATQEVYVSCGSGFVDVIKQLDADRYEPARRVPTAPGAGTSLFVPALHRLFVAVPQRVKQEAALWEYAVGP